jgi:hypothetical protein
MIALSPALFLSSANALVQHDDRVPGVSWHGELDPSTRDTHRPEDCVRTAAFITHVGYASHRIDRGVSLWPFATAADCEHLGALAASRKVLTAATPLPGAILLRWSDVERRYVRASVVVSSYGAPTERLGWVYVCDVIEGHATVGAARRESRRSRVSEVRRTRRICIPIFNDRFIDWVALDRREALGRVA